MAAGHWSGRSRHRADNRRGPQREPLAVGWGVRDGAMRGATVVAAFERDRLGDGLARLHGHGFGPSARVLDGGRGDLGGQLARAGLPVDLADRLAGTLPPKTTSLLLVHAPARTEQVVELLGRAGAAAVEIVPPGQPPDLPAVAHLPTDAGIAEATG